MKFRLLVLGLFLTVVSACSPQVVDPTIAERWVVRDGSVDVSDIPIEEFSFDGTSYRGNFLSIVESFEHFSPRNAETPVRISVHIQEMNISVAGSSRASGQFSVVNAQTGALLFGPEPFSVIDPAPSTGGGGLVGIVLTSAARAIAATSERAYKNEVEGLARLINTSVYVSIFGYAQPQG